MDDGSVCFCGVILYRGKAGCPVFGAFGKSRGLDTRFLIVFCKACTDGVGDLHADVTRMGRPVDEYIRLINAFRLAPGLCLAAGRVGM